MPPEPRSAAVVVTRPRRLRLPIRLPDPVSVLEQHKPAHVFARLMPHAPMIGHAIPLTSAG